MFSKNLVVVMFAFFGLGGCDQEDSDRGQNITATAPEDIDANIDIENGIVPSSKPAPASNQPAQSQGPVATAPGQAPVSAPQAPTPPSAPKWPFDLPVWPLRNTIPGNFVPFSKESSFIQADLAKIRASNPGVIPFIRYITLSHIDFLKMDSKDAFVQLKTDMLNSLSVLLNHLSTQSSIVKPVALEGSMSIFRIDIRNYGWSRAQWERLVSADGNDRNKEAYPFNNDFDLTVAQIAKEINTRVAIVRGDWLITEASKPRSYHDLLNIPRELDELDERLGIDRIDNIARTLEGLSEPEAIRAGIPALKSGVSVNNRVIERHDANQGYYWISYDFAAAKGVAAKNIFSAPLGPNREVLRQTGSRQLGQQIAFAPDGGEVIFTLPNGLQGYLLVNGEGSRIDAAPINVVFDASARKDSGEIRNGASCFKCHGAGILDATDGLRSYMNKADPNLFPRTVIDAVNNIYLEQGALNAVYAQDNDRFRPKVDKAIMIGARKNQIDHILNYYDAPLSYDMVASELNMTTEQLENEEEVLSDELSILLEASRARNLNREEFEDAYLQFVEELFDLRR